VVVDVVESVRLMQQHETDVINRWRRFVNEVQTQVLPKHGGRLVKSLGDGMLLEFESVPDAVAASLEMQQRVSSYNAGRDPAAAIELRVAAHVSDVVIDDLDMYGVGVNLTARLAALAEPAQIVVSSAVRDQLIDGHDASLVDLGECFLKHVDTPVRAWRIEPLGVPQRPATAPVTPAQWQTAVAVVPFDLVSDANGARTPLARVLADDLARLLSASGIVRVVSTLSTQSLVARAVTAREIGGLLGVRYVVSGSIQVRADAVRVGIELADAETELVLWTGLVTETLAALDAPNCDTLALVAQTITRRVADSVLTRATERPMPNVESAALLLSSVVWMHRMSSQDSERSKRALDYLSDRHPRAAEPHAWVAKWHMLRVAQGWSKAHEHDAARARDHLKRALDSNPDHSLALAIEGHTLAYEYGDLAGAKSLLDAALRNNASEPLAWLFFSNLLANQGCGEQALSAARSALALSPLDPTRFMFDMFASYAALSAGENEEALRLAEASMRANSLHAPTYPLLIIARMLAGRADDARALVVPYIAKVPSASVRRYVARHRGLPSTVAQYADALRAAGVPD
jgi:adenylate cyclase